MLWVFQCCYTKVLLLRVLLAPFRAGKSWLSTKRMGNAALHPGAAKLVMLPTLLQSVDLISVKLPCDGNVNGALRGLAWLGGVPSHPLDDIAAGDRGAVKGRIHGALLQAHHEGEHWAASHGAKLLDDR